MKRSIGMILMAAMIGLVSVTAVMAEGAQERADGTAQPQRPFFNSEKVSVTGTVELTASGVELAAEDGQTYELMYPRFLAEGVEIETGDTVSVEGFLVPGPRWAWNENSTEKHLRVETATIDGKEYELAANFQRGAGPRTGPGYGPGYIHGQRPRGGAYGPGACWGNGYGAGQGYGPGAGRAGRTGRPGAYQSGAYGGRGPGMMGRW